MSLNFLEPSHHWTRVRRHSRTTAKQTPDRRFFLKRGVSARQRKQKAPQLQMIRLNKFEMPPSGAQSVRRARRELQLPSTIVWRVLRRRPHMTPPLPYSCTFPNYMLYMNKNSGKYNYSACKTDVKPYMMMMMIIT